MKKILILIMALALLILPACADSGENNATGNDNSVQIADSNGDTEGFGDVTINQLATHVFLLEETEFQITEEQAEEMVVLWQVAKSLIESSTAADAELNSVLNQIEAIFTEEQIAYILTLNSEEINMNQVLAEFGYSIRGGDGSFANEDLTPEELEAMRAAAGGDLGAVTGEGPGRGQGGGGGGVGRQDITPEMQATREAMREEMGGAGFGMSTAIFDAVIDFLQSKIG